MKKSVFVRIAAAVMAIVLCLCSMGALAGCTKTRSINVLVYGQYIDLDVISNFKKENGIKVNVDECDTPEELYNKAVNGDQSYDLICTSDYIIERFIKENRLSELNFDNIPNIKNIGEVYLEKSKSFDPENKYSVPLGHSRRYLQHQDGFRRGCKELEDVLQREVFRKDNHVQQHPRLLPCRA